MNNIYTFTMQKTGELVSIGTGSLQFVAKLDLLDKELIMDYIIWSDGPFGRLLC